MATSIERAFPALLALAFAGPAFATGSLDDGTIAGPIPAGSYTLDPTHSSLFFRVDHLGMSRYTARFTRLAAELELDPRAPEDAVLTATVDPLSLDTGYPLDDLDFDALLTGPDWLDAANHPLITFHSTEIRQSGPEAATITGELTLAGVTLPIMLEATFNGGYAGHVLDPGGARIGFSAAGVLQRSAFGIDLGLPLPGSSIGVGDRVEFFIEAEFTKPRNDADG